MSQLYRPNTANYLRLKTDKFFVNYENCYNFKGLVDESIKYIESFQLLNPGLWKRFVYQFRSDADGYVDVESPSQKVEPYKNVLELCVALTSGSFMHVTDYASAGKLWTEDSKMAALILTKTAQN